jgi:Immunity protein Imm1
VQVEFRGRIAGKYRASGTPIDSTDTDALTAAITELYVPPPVVGRWTDADVHAAGANHVLMVVVQPDTGRTVLNWGGTAHTYNDAPFEDAPLLPVDGDDDPLNYWMRNSYIPAGDAQRAIAEYAQTGERPACVHWQDFGFEVHRLPHWLESEPDAVPHYHLITQ